MSNESPIYSKINVQILVLLFSEAWGFSVVSRNMASFHFCCYRNWQVLDYLPLTYPELVFMLPHLSDSPFPTPFLEELSASPFLFSSLSDPGRTQDFSTASRIGCWSWRIPLNPPHQSRKLGDKEFVASFWGNLKETIGREKNPTL